MENDRELLELAAKAAGVKYSVRDDEYYKTHKFFGLWIVYDYEPSEYTRRYWNPLTDDGDALRLAVKLSFCHTQWFNHDPPDVMIGYKTPDGKGHNWIEDHNGDPEAATRLAITRAAAEVGRAME